MRDLSRRGFVKRAASGLAGLSTIALLDKSVRGANDKIHVAAIGVRTQGTIMARSFIKTGRAEVVAVCDVDRKILDRKTKEIESTQNRARKSYTDFRRVLEDKDVDAVIIIQHGTMQRSGAHFQEAREYVRSGKLGKIGLIRCYSILGRKSIGHKPNSKPPSHLDYDFWLGPAAEKPYKAIPERISSSFTLMTSSTAWCHARLPLRISLPVI